MQGRTKRRDLSFQCLCLLPHRSDGHERVFDFAERHEYRLLVLRLNLTGLCFDSSLFVPQRLGVEQWTNQSRAGGAELRPGFDEIGEMGTRTTKHSRECDLRKPIGLSDADSGRG